MDNEIQLGKAYCKVVLYEKLPNLVTSQTKLRESYEMILTFMDNESANKSGGGIQQIGVGDSQGNPISGGMIPSVCYEPVDNFMDNSSVVASSGSIIWKTLEWSEMSNLFLSLMYPSLSQLPTSPTTTKGSFSSKQQAVSSIKYSEEMYKMYGLPYFGHTAYYSSSPSTDFTTSTATETKTYIFQSENNSAVWWGVGLTGDSAQIARVPGGGFWMSILPATKYQPDSNDLAKRSLIAIKLNGDFGSGNNSEYLLVIDNRNSVVLRHLLDGHAVDIPINMPHLSEAFQNGEEIRVGFFILAGRLVIYTDPSRYDVVDIAYINSEGKQDFYPCFDLSDLNIKVYGYGCSAYINMCEMTFHKRCWMRLPWNGKKMYEGYISPVTDTGLVAAGQWSNGFFISWNMTEEQYINNNNQKMYAGQFCLYREIDLVGATSSSGGSAGTSLTPPKGISNSGHGLTVGTGEYSAVSSSYHQNYSKIVNAARQWGFIDVVRHPSISSANQYSPSGANDNTNYVQDPFYLCYMETEDIKDSLGNTHYRVGFPILYNLFAQKKMDDSQVTGEMDTFSSVDITNQVTSLDITYALDDSSKPTSIVKSAHITVVDNNGSMDYTKYLTRARGVKIWLQWSTSGISPISESDNPIFSGVAFGETSSMEPGFETISFSCYDYFKLLERIKIKNCPYYDGFELASVIKDISERGGVKFNDNIDHTPGRVPFFFLGSGFSFDKPMHRYEGSESLKSCMSKAIQAFPYYLWFDDNCVLQLSVVPGNFDWSASGPGWDSGIYKYYYRYFDSITDTHPEKLILNQIQMTSTLASSVYNSFRLDAVDRTTIKLHPVTDSRRASLVDPDSIGYLGHVSEITIQQPALDGSAARSYLDMIMKMYATPGFESTFTTSGHRTNYLPGQFISVKQTVAAPLNQKFRVSQISHKYNAEQNQWLTDISGYQITNVTWTPSSSSTSSSV